MGGASFLSLIRLSILQFTDDLSIVLCLANLLIGSPIAIEAARLWLFLKASRWTSIASLTGISDKADLIVIRCERNMYSGREKTCSILLSLVDNLHYAIQ